MEMLVSLVILALILALLPGAFRLARQVWTATAMLDRDSGRDAGLDFLETRLAEAMPLFEPGKAGLVNILFSGSKDGVRFVAPSRNGPAGGGLYRYSIELRPRDGAPSCAGGPGRALSWAAGRGSKPARRRGASSGRRRHQRRVSLFWSPRAAAGARPGRQQWKRTDALPDLVELNIARRRPGGSTTRFIVTELRLRNAS